MTKIIEYYVEGHTGEGYVNYLYKNLQDIDRIILLQDDNPTFITAVCKQIMKRYTSYVMEVIKSIENKNLIEGIIIRDLSLSIINDRIYSSNNQSDKVIRISFTKEKQIKNSEKYKLDKNIQTAYNYFQQGLLIHEQLETIYIAEMNFEKADQVINNLLNDLFSDVSGRDRSSIIYERLFGTNTPDGIMNTIEGLINPIARKIFILGRAGTGKSYLMNKVLEKCIDYGIDVELYRCSLDPNSIDMLIIRELNVCIHDNTKPHVISKAYNNLKVIDMYKETVNQMTEEINENKIINLQKLYKKAMQSGLSCLQTNKLIQKDDKGKFDGDLLENAIKEIIKSI